MKGSIHRKSTLPKSWKNNLLYYYICQAQSAHFSQYQLCSQYLLTIPTILTIPTYYYFVKHRAHFFVRKLCSNIAAHNTYLLYLQYFLYLQYLQYLLTITFVKHKAHIFLSTNYAQILLPHNTYLDDNFRENSLTRNLLRYSVEKV